MIFQQVGDYMISRYSKFTTLISNINRSINHIKTEEMQQFGLKSFHVSCLYYINKFEDGLTATELCNLCEEDKGAISRSIDFLVQHGFVQYDNDDNKKKYRAKIHLTLTGKEVAKRVNTITEKAVEIGSTGLTDNERETMYKCLEIISNNLNKYCDK